jgi:hypothetical protein
MSATLTFAAENLKTLGTQRNAGRTLEKAFYRKVRKTTAKDAKQDRFVVKTVRIEPVFCPASSTAWVLRLAQDDIV